MTLSARSVLVTGASRGLGLEFVKQLLKSSSPPEVLIAACRDPSNATNLQSLAASNSSVKIIKLDVEKDDEIESAFQETKAVLGDKGLNLLINNAGYFDKAGTGAIRDVTREQLQKHFDANVSSPIMVTQKFLPLLTQAASSSVKSEVLSASKAGVIMISSIMGSQEHTFHTGHGVSLYYKCSKTALTMASIMIGREVKESGILVAALHPGWVRTDMGTSQAPVGPDESVEGMLKVIGNAGDESHGKLIDYKGVVLPF